MKSKNKLTASAGRMPALVLPLPTDDSPQSVKARMDAVENGHDPLMPGLAKMTKKQMAATLQSIWTLCDEMGIQRRNSDGPNSTRLVIYGRVLGAIKNGPLQYGQNAEVRRGEKDADTN